MFPRQKLDVQIVHRFRSFNFYHNNHLDHHLDYHGSNDNFTSTFALNKQLTEFAKIKKKQSVFGSSLGKKRNKIGWTVVQSSKFCDDGPKGGLVKPVG